MGALEVISENSFYKFPIYYVKKNLSKDYLEFLKNSGYAPNLDSAQYLVIGKNMFKANKNYEILKIRFSIEEETKYIVNISQLNARTLSKVWGYQLPTAAIMYKIFIPHIKRLVDLENQEAKANLKEMKSKAEWLEDLILNKTKIKIGNSEKEISLPLENTGFDRSDINEFGYPYKQLRHNGEFCYWSPKKGEMAAFRDRGPGLGLNCVRRAPSDSSEDLGLRLTKFI